MHSKYLLPICGLLFHLFIVSFFFGTTAIHFKAVVLSENSKPSTVNIKIIKGVWWIHDCLLHYSVKLFCMFEIFYTQKLEKKERKEGGREGRRKAGK